jgi:hypothetical protein
MYNYAVKFHKLLTYYHFLRSTPTIIIRKANVTSWIMALVYVLWNSRMKED